MEGAHWSYGFAPFGVCIDAGVAGIDVVWSEGEEVGLEGVEGGFEEGTGGRGCEGEAKEVG